MPEDVRRSVRVPMMDVGKMWVLVRHNRMCVLMRVWLLPIPFEIVIVLVMFVMTMTVLVFQRIVRVQMFVPLRQV